MITRNTLYLIKDSFIKSLCRLKTFGIVTFTLSINAHNANALDFTFSDFTAGSSSAEGTLSIDDVAVASETLTEFDILDWEIRVTAANPADNYILYGDGGGFGVDNSNISFFTSGSVNSSQLILDPIFCITTQSSCVIIDQHFSTSSAFGNTLAGQIGGGTPASLIANATAVPFEVSPNLGLIILAGIWGISRLRKRARTRKLTNNN